MLILQILTTPAETGIFNLIQTPPNLQIAMETNSQEQTLKDSQDPVWDAKRMQAILRLHAQRCSELYPDGPESRLTIQMSPEQIARVESLMHVPMHLLDLDDKLHRETLAIQRERAACGQMEFHKKKIQKQLEQNLGEWRYWSSLFSSQVNALRPQKASSTPE